jgi:hypothetical protein
MPVHGIAVGFFLWVNADVLHVGVLIPPTDAPVAAPARPEDKIDGKTTETAPASEPSVGHACAPFNRS